MRNKTRSRVAIIMIIFVVVLIIFTNRGFSENRLAADSLTPTKVQDISVIKENGGRVDWSHSGNNKIVFDKMGADGYYDIYLMNPDGSDEKCLTGDTKGQLPQKHNGNPAWHPSGEYIVFQSEKQKVPEQHSKKANPGSGLLNDIWVMTSDGRKFYKLVNLEFRLRNAPGTLHPHFSHDGRKLFWAERIGKGDTSKSTFGKWILKIADFLITDDGPKLENIKSFSPGGQQDFYESHGFSKDDNKLLFSGNLQRSQPAWGLDIYEMDIKSQKLKRLTETIRDWDEHAQYSPSGEKIIWMSSKGYKMKDGLKADFWVMDRDGSNKEQLTFFNKPGHSHYTGKMIVAADSSWSPDGKRIIAYIKTESVGAGSKGSIIMIDLNGAP